jgi:hypothetical protein
MRIRETYGPYRLAWSRTGGSQPSDRGSNPLGATNFLQKQKLIPNPHQGSMMDEAKARQAVLWYNYLITKRLRKGGCNGKKV